MTRVIRYNITGEASVREFLKSRRYPHAVIVQLKQNKEQVRLNGRPAFLYEKMSAGDVLDVEIREIKHSSHQIVPAGNMPEIVYEDDDILVVNKPSGMSIHPSLNHYEDSLANAVMAYYKDSDPGFIFRCVNRLDKETSGLTIIAKNALSGAILDEDVKMRDIHRTYMALVEGNFFNEESAVTEAYYKTVNHKTAYHKTAKDELIYTVDAPIARKKDSAILRCVDFERGVRAVTHFQVISYLEEYDYSLIKLRLETGRTHQIRVHMKHIGHPLPADYLYNPDYTYLDRVPLHSYSLSFKHPVTGEPMYFEAGIPFYNMHKRK